MARKRTYHVVERGRRGPGGSITWRVEVEASCWLYASEVCAQIHRAGDVFRRREIETTRAIATTPAESAWHAARTRHREQRIRANPLLIETFKD
jgi:hypothetical protein